jgi:HAD superfamily hydrolase (TIGR01509 family)
MNTIPYFSDRKLQAAIENAVLVVFDMNGLIIDDERVQFESVNQAMEDLRISISETYWIDKCVGKRADDYFHEILKEHKKNFTYSDISLLVGLKNKLYHDVITQQVDELKRPGVQEFINYLSADNPRPLALCTSAHPEEIETILGESGLGLKGHFSYIVSGNDVEKSKPDPEIYAKVAATSGLLPSTCLVFEDSGLGVRAATGAGMSCIAVPNRFTEHQDFTNALCIIDSLRQNAQTCQTNCR